MAKNFHVSVTNNGQVMTELDGTGCLVLMLNNRGLEIDANGGVFGTINKQVLAESLIDLLSNIGSTKPLLEALIERTAKGEIEGVSAYARPRE